MYGIEHNISYRVYGIGRNPGPCDTSLLETKILTKVPLRQERRHHGNQSRRRTAGRTQSATQKAIRGFGVANLRRSHRHRTPRIRDQARNHSRNLRSTRPLRRGLAFTTFLSMSPRPPILVPSSVDGRNRERKSKLAADAYGLRDA